MRPFVRKTKLRLKTIRDIHARRRRGPRMQERMRSMGVNRYRYLGIIPILILAILLAAGLKKPDMQQAYFRPDPEVSINPLMGWAIDARTDPTQFAGDCTLVYAELTWREFEPAEGVYDFETFERENHLETWWRQGKRVILRFVMDDPADAYEIDIPDWLHAMTGGAGYEYSTAAGTGFSPDYANDILRDRHSQAIAVLGERYDSHPGVAYVEISSVGHDGLWQFSGERPGAIVLRGYLEDYLLTFTETELLAPRSFGSTAELGLYNADLGDHDATWNWLDLLASGGPDGQTGLETDARADFWQDSVSGARLTPEIPAEEQLTDGLGELIRQLQQTHASYVICPDAAELSAQARQGMQQALGSIGYRLRIRRAEWPESIRSGYRLRVRTVWQNDGVAAMNADWPVAIRLTRNGEEICRAVTDVDVRAILPGESEEMLSILLPTDAEPGAAAVSVAVLDPHTNEPGVVLDSAGETENGWFVLGEIEIR